MIARLEQLQFRPRLHAGRPVEASATLIYLSAPAIRKFIDTTSNAWADGSNASGDGSQIAGGP